MNEPDKISNLVSKALLYESKGKRVSEKFIKEDKDAHGYIPEVKAAAIICDILRIPPPLGPDKQSSEARRQILTQNRFKVIPHPVNQNEYVVEYGKFLKSFRAALRTTPLIASNPYVKSDFERTMAANKENVKKNDMTKEEVVKAIDMNLPKYYRSTTEAYLRMKPPGGRMKLPDFGRFMRSINLDLDDSMLLTIFRNFDKNHNGAIDAWEFFDGFGGSISGHQDSSTSLCMDKLPFKEPKQVKAVKLSASETCELIKQRLPLHFRSSTKAFLAAKGGADPRSNTIAFKDLKIFLQNLNIIVPDESIKGLFDYLDDDGSGGVTAKEFIQTFGHAISGERSDNIQDANHLSYHNTRPDDRVPIVPPKHKWTYEEVKKTLGERLGMIHTSSTMAFMKLKKSSSRFMTVSDLERILFNLNIDPPRSIVQQLYNDMDKNKDQEITCAEFLKYFGSHINGFAGSFETKPDWFYTELSALSAHIDRLEGNYEDPIRSPEGPEEKTQERKLTHAQEVKFIRKFGMSPEEMRYLDDSQQNTTPKQTGTMEFTRPKSASGERPKSAGSERPRSASSERPRSAGPARRQSNSNNSRSGGGFSGFRERPQTSSSDRPRSASSERPRSAVSERPWSAGSARPRSARDIQNAVNFSNTHSPVESSFPDDPFEPIITSIGVQTKSHKNNQALKPTKTTNIFVNTSNNNDQFEYEGPETTTDINDFTDGELLKELRNRKSVKERIHRSKSLPKARKELDKNWQTSTSRFGGFSQGPHYKSTVANKLKTAQKIADMLEAKKEKKAKKKVKSRSRYDVGRESSPIMNDKKFRF